MKNSGIESFRENLRNLPTTLRESISRSGRAVTDRTRSQAVFSNIFLHVHATRTHPRTFGLTATFGLGIAALSFFFILLATGILLMVY